MVVKRNVPNPSRDSRPAQPESNWDELKRSKREKRRSQRHGKPSQNALDPELEQSSVSPFTRAKRLLLDWRFVTIAGLILTTSLTTLSIAFILKLPSIPNCPSIFWPLATASIRLHCAQIAAGKRTVPDLIEAIELVSGLPKEHPLYKEASRWIEDWSNDLLDAAQDKFNTGKLDEAIAAAKKIPPHAAAAQQVEQRIATWQNVWKEAESIVANVDKFLSKRNWKDAFNQATKLLAIDNPYWQTQRYGEISERIAIAKDEITKLASADRAIRNGDVDELVKAFKGLTTIPETSDIYKDVQDMKPRIGKRLMTLAENAADSGALDQAVKIANRIPETIKVKQDVDDFMVLVNAQLRVNKGQLPDIDDAIAQAERIPVGRYFYDRAQRLAVKWNAVARDIAKLDRTRDLARSGSPGALQAAIAEGIGPSNPKFKEADKFISQNNNAQLQADQDQNILDQANTIASAGDPISIQNAIDLARQVESGRPLYSQAQAQIKGWSAALRSQENPTVSPTRPESIAPNPAFSQDESLLAQANAMAQSGGDRPDDLLNAISIAQQVSPSSRSQAQRLIEQWSGQVLNAATGQAAYDTPGAISLASRVPSGTAAYGQAQNSIAAWKKQIGQR